MAAPYLFPPGAFPEYGLDCTQLSNGTWHCSPVEQQCDIFIELGVICKLPNNTFETTQLPNTLSTSDNQRGSDSTCNDKSIAGIGVLVALLLAVLVGWIVSCVILLRRGHTVHKQQ